MKLRGSKDEPGQESTALTNTNLIEPAVSLDQIGSQLDNCLMQSIHESSLPDFQLFVCDREKTADKLSMRVLAAR